MKTLTKFVKPLTTEQREQLSALMKSVCYPAGIMVTEEGLAGVNLQRADFHGEWNYTISPGTLRQ